MFESYSMGSASKGSMMVDMPQVLSYVESDDFARAIALSTPDLKIDPPLWRPWAYFRLGMYRTAATEKIDLSNQTCLDRQLLPVLVSMAACAQHAQVKDILHNLSVGAISERLWIALAKNLSVYMPKVSIDILKRFETVASNVERALMLVRADLKEEAAFLIESTLAKKGADFSAELLLLKLACSTFPPHDQLSILNKILESFSLSKLNLRDANQSAFPGNLEASDRLPDVDGPLVSIIMTTFNSSERVRYAIESMLNQTYKNIEIIVVDDVSSDDTRSIVKEMSGFDKRVRLLSLSHNMGTYYAKTIGAKHAQGEFITCMDSDDWSHPTKIEMQVLPLLKNAALIATASSGIRLYDDGTFDVAYTVSSKLIRLSYPSLLFRKSAVQDTAGLWDSAVRINADVEFLARLKLHFGGDSVLLLPQPLSIMSRNGMSLTGSSAPGGFGKQYFPRMRLDYIESFNQWHINCLRSGGLPVVISEPSVWINNHPFEVPAEMMVDINSIYDISAH